MHKFPKYEKFDLLSGLREEVSLNSLWWDGCIVIGLFS